MNALNQNPYSELIYRFMDGNTNGVQQKILFDALSDNQELQNEFQQAVEIAKGFQMDKSVLTPSAQLTKSVFQTAGFSLPMQFANPSNTVKKLPSKLKTFAIPAISAFIGALLTTSLFFAIYNPFNNSQIENKIQIANSQIPAQKMEIPIIKSEENQNIFPHNVNLSNIHKKEAINSLNTKSKVNDFSQNIVFANSVYTKHRINLLHNNYSKINFQKNTELLNTQLPEVNLLNLSIELKGITGLAFFPQRTIQPEAFSLTNNIAIGLMYQFDKHNSAGISLGKESLQMYSFNQIGNEYNFNLEPNLTWAGANYRYTGNEIYGSIYPFGELIAAGTKFGPMGKAIIGINYNPENFLSMSLGLEGTSLMYRFMNKIKTTEKISLVYNFGFHF